VTDVPKREKAACKGATVAGSWGLSANAVFPRQPLRGDPGRQSQAKALPVVSTRTCIPIVRSCGSPWNPGPAHFGFDRLLRADVWPKLFCCERAFLRVCLKKSQN
jgi:hypothetical protein